MCISYLKSSTHYDLIIIGGDEEQSPETVRSCSIEIGFAVGGLLLTERLIALVTAIIVLVCWLITRYVKIILYSVIIRSQYSTSYKISPCTFIFKGLAYAATKSIVKSMDSGVYI